MTPIDPNLYTRYAPPGLPPLTAHVTGPPRAAIAAYQAYCADPIFQPAPTLDEVRLVAQYCQEFVNAPLFTNPADELRQLRAAVVQIRTVKELADWLWDCRAIGIEPI